MPISIISIQSIWPGYARQQPDIHPTDEFIRSAPFPWRRAAALVH